jgi:hypothetical protein
LHGKPFSLPAGLGILPAWFHAIQNHKYSLPVCFWSAFLSALDARSVRKKPFIPILIIQYRFRPLLA